jgi:hypothetical protein
MRQNRPEGSDSWTNQRPNARDDVHPHELEADPQGVEIDSSDLKLGAPWYNNYITVEAPVEGEDFTLVKLDPYLIARVCGVTDPCLFHMLKTILRFGRKNDDLRELKSLQLTLERAIELEETGTCRI